MSPDPHTPPSTIAPEPAAETGTLGASTDEVLVPSTAARRDLPVSGSIFDTSEIELLISGAFLFSLFHIFDALRGGIEFFSIHFPDGEVFRLFFAYLLMADVGLMLAFAGHLGLRGFWIGLLGLHSVFPDPVDYDDLTYGPLYTRHMKEHWADIPAMIGKTDRMASLIFSFSMTFVAMGLYFAAFFGVFSGLWFLVEQKHPEWLESLPSPLLPVFAFLGLQVLAIMLDRIYRGRTPEDVPAPIRLAARFIFPLTDKAMLGGLTGPIMSKFRAHLQGPKFIALMVVYMFLLIASIFVALATGSDKLSPHGYDLFPANSPQTLAAGYYQDHQGDRGFKNPKPRIQSDVIKDPYIKLFLPYSPRLDKSMSRRCPEVAAAMNADDGSTDPDVASRAIACLVAHYRVSLDGRVLEDLDLVFSRDSEKGRRGLTAYLPTAELATGRHDLLVEEVDHPLKDGAKEQERHYIPFWK